MLRGAGLTDEDLQQPLVAVVNTWSEVTPCNVHLRALAEPLKGAIREAGGTPLEFNTVVVSDGITMGTPGMRASLVSREVIADSIELAVAGHAFDAVLVLERLDASLRQLYARLGWCEEPRRRYDPEAAVSLQQTFVELSKGRSQDRFSALFASHPPSQSRVAANEQTAWQLGRGGERGKARYQREISQLMKRKPAYDLSDKAKKAIGEKTKS